MAKLKIKFHPTFFVFVIFLLFSNNFLSLFSYLICVFLHELGHSFVANCLGYKLNQITFLPFGASLSGKENVFYKIRHEILVALAGPITNLVLCGLCLSLFWLFPSSYLFLQDFYYANLVTFFFNLFPVYPLDGGRVLFAMLKSKNSINKSYKIVKIVGIVFSIFLFVLFIISSFVKINFTLGLTSIFLVCGIFFEDKSSYYVANFNFLDKTKKLSTGLETNILTVSENTNLYYILRKLNKYKYNLINILNFDGKIKKSLSEEELNNIFINFPLNSKIGEVV